MTPSLEWSQYLPKKVIKITIGEMQIKFLEQDPADGEFSAGWGLEKTRIVIPSLFILKKK